jgi:hypothetical protein
MRRPGDAARSRFLCSRSAAPQPSRRPPTRLRSQPMATLSASWQRWRQSAGSARRRPLPGSVPVWRAVGAACPMVRPRPKPAEPRPVGREPLAGLRRRGGDATAVSPAVGDLRLGRGILGVVLTPTTVGCLSAGACRAGWYSRRVRASAERGLVQGPRASAKCRSVWFMLLLGIVEVAFGCVCRPGVALVGQLAAMPGSADGHAWLYRQPAWP